MLALKTRGLHLGEAAIDKQLRPRHVARIIRCERHYCFGDLIRLTQSDAARLDTVEDGVVPVSVEPCDFGARVETQNVAVRDMYVLAFLCNPRHFGRYGPAHFSLDHDCVAVGREQLDHFDSKVWNGIRKRAPNNIDATTDRHDALAAIR